MQYELVTPGTLNHVIHSILTLWYPHTHEHLITSTIVLFLKTRN